jgi:hypothetical protein
MVNLLWLNLHSYKNFLAAMKVLAATELLNSCMKEQWHYPLSLKSNKPNKIKKWVNRYKNLLTH